MVMMVVVVKLIRLRCWVLGSVARLSVIVTVTRIVRLRESRDHAVTDLALVTRDLSQVVPLRPPSLMSSHT